MNDDVGRLPSGLWARLRADPQRAPEQLALAAAESFGPQAQRWAQERRGVRYTDASLAAATRKRHATLARLEGAATGVGGLLTILPDLVALAWIQSRMIFFIAAAYGYDPNDPMRPAEALVLFDFYPDPVAARRALDGAGTSIAASFVGSRLQHDEALALRLGKLLGVSGAKHLAGRAIPGFAILFNSASNERSTRRLGSRAIRFYGG